MAGNQIILISPSKRGTSSDLGKVTGDQVARVKRERMGQFGNGGWPGRRRPRARWGACGNGIGLCGIGSGGGCVYVCVRVCACACVCVLRKTDHAHVTAAVQAQPVRVGQNCTITASDSREDYMGKNQ